MLKKTVGENQANMIVILPFLFSFFQGSLAISSIEFNWVENREGCDATAKLNFLDNGIKDIACLFHMYNREQCIFSGSTLSYEGSLTVSGGCPNQRSDNQILDLTLFHPMYYGKNAFSLGRNQDLEQQRFMDEVNDIILNPPRKNSSSLYKTEKIVLGDSYKMKVGIIYDKAFRNEFGSEKFTRINAVMAHAQTWLTHSTLDSKITMVVDSTYKYYNNIIPATGDNIGQLTEWIETKLNNLPVVDNFVTFSYEGNQAGTVGIAWLGTVCGYLPYSVNINEYFQTDSATGQVVAHEIGHNLGMNHDFTDNGVDDPRFCPLDGNSCIGLGGVMDYYQETTNGWTCCSNQDMKTYFADSVSDMCLEENNDEITTSNPTGGTPTTITTTTTPKECKDQWFSKICSFLKVMIKNDLGDKFCGIEGEDDITDIIRGHCWKKCCKCKKNRKRCKNIPESFLTAEETTVENLLLIMKAISEGDIGDDRGEHRMDFDMNMMKTMTEEEIGNYLEHKMLQHHGYRFINLDDD